jgi:hypothetical protein
LILPELTLTTLESRLTGERNWLQKKEDLI